MISVSFPVPPSGTVRIPPSKSILHRMILASSFGDGPVRVLCGDGTLSQDIEATIRGITALGASVFRKKPGVLEIHPADRRSEKTCSTDCGESGSTFRFLLPIAAALGRNAEFTGCGRLPERPVSNLIHLLREHGITFSAEKLPFRISGQMIGGICSIPGDISSQYVTGLMFALSLLPEGGRILLTSPLHSADYVKMTIQVLEQFGIYPETETNGWTLPANCVYRSPGEITAEGDWSNGAFFLAAGAMRGEISVTGLNPHSLQGDKRILDILRRFGAAIRMEGEKITVSAGELRGIEEDIEEIPDLLPVLTVLGSAARGTTRFLHCGRTRLKECDRLQASLEMARALGAGVEISGDTLILSGTGKLHGARIRTYNDHRMVMAAATAAVSADGPVQIAEPEAVCKSYPDFFRDLQRTGGVLL